MRGILFRSFFYFGLILLGFGLFKTQVIEGRHYRDMSEQNRIRLIPTEAPRGRVFDSKGRLLATNRPSYDVIATPEDITADVFRILSKILNLPEKEIRRRMSMPREYPFAPALIIEDITRETAFRIEELRPELPGVDIRVSFLRYYPYAETGSHLIGYIGKISPVEYQRFADKERYGLNSLIGRAGIEKIFDSRLRGVRGGRQIEVNAKGQLVRVLSEKLPEPGEDITLTLDLDFQKKVMEIIKDKNASVAMIDLKTDELMVLASAPAFDPNVFVAPGKGKERLSFLKNPKSPLLDRGVGAAYPPGSVFKLVTALTALETGKITPHTRFDCGGEYHYGKAGGHTFHCWYKKGHGRLNLYQAIERSCNVYFYNVGRKLLPEDIAKYAHTLGLGESMKLEATNVSAGLVPDSAWKEARLKQKWYDGETLSYAIGQSYLLVSPLQILKLVSIIAKEGMQTDPHLLKENTHPSSTQHLVAIHPENLKVLKRAMLQVVQSEFGTGQLARVDFMKLAAKTGTAQAPPKEAHSWMGGFFPYENPEVAFVIFVEHGGSGGITCARIMRSIMKEWKETYVQPVA